LNTKPSTGYNCPQNCGNVSATNAKGEYRWRLKSGNGQVIATGGEGYTSKAGALNGIEAVKRDAVVANVDEV
jgi:uncharacterized protein YegP (UPF0339 family)